MQNSKLYFNVDGCLCETVYWFSCVIVLHVYFKSISLTLAIIKQFDNSVRNFSSDYIYDWELYEKYSVDSFLDLL